MCAVAVTVTALRLAPLETVLLSLIQMLLLIQMLVAVVVLEEASIDGWMGHGLVLT